jgi:NAD+ synthase (glutamine-hydrolysing)
MKIAIAQLNFTVGDLSHNAEIIIQSANQAAQAGADLLITSELSLCGYPPRDLLLNPGFVQATEEKLSAIAQAVPPDLAVLVGFVEGNPQADEQGRKSLFNSVALLHRGAVQQTFHKRLLPTYDVFDEDRYFEPGQQSDYFTLKLDSPQQTVKVGVTICEDLWNDEEFWGKRNYAVNPLADLAQLEVDLVVNLSASPYSVGKYQVREAMLRHSANRYHVPIIYANQIGGNDDLLFDGGSVAFNQQGEAVCRAKPFATDFTLLEFDPKQQDLLPATLEPIIESEDEQIWRALVLGLCDYSRKCGFTKALIGLSGGIDSSLVAAIATEAFGAENIMGILLPSPYSSDHSLSDAEALIKNLGIKSQTLPIKKAMEAYDDILEPLFAGTEFGVAEENIQARIRGNLLMAVANKFGYLLLSTGNKSEMAVGYCTLYGDMSGGFSVIADVPKTRVFSVCQWLNRDREVIPANIISKPPSAELKPGQQDQDTLPPYEILDDILHRIIVKNESIHQISEAGHDLETVEKVMKMLSRAEFKRRQSPPGLKITERAFGTGWRMPIASRWVSD